MLDDSRQFMLDSLRELQGSLLLLMERAKRTQVQEGWMLEWALTELLEAYRDFRAERITWWEAARWYQVVSNVQLECDAAVLDAQMTDSYDWHMAKKVVSR